MSDAARMPLAWLILAAVLWIAGPAAAEPMSRPGIDAPELARLGPHGVGLRRLALTEAGQVDVLAYDPKTGTAPLRDRVLAVDVWYPARPARGAKTVTYADALPGEPPRGLVAFTAQGIAVRNAPPAAGPAEGFPLVILSHGYSGTPAAMTWLAENLASKGYVVAAPHHQDPDISDRTKGAQPMLRRPLDIAFVAHDLQARAQAGQLMGADGGRVALIGYSMGGYGVITVAGAGLNPTGAPALGVPGGYLKPYVRGGPKAGDLAVPGLRAVVAIAPAGGGGFNAWGPEGLADLKTPLMVVGGDRDRTVGFEGGIKTVFDQAIHAERYLLVFENGGHNIGMDGPPDQMHAALWDNDWFEDPVWRKDRTAAVQQHFITAFLDRFVKGDGAMTAYLDTDTPLANDAKWPAAGGSAYGAISPGGPGATWKGFPRNHAVGLELHHAAAAR